jgi:hypothetical protein
VGPEQPCDEEVAAAELAPSSIELLPPILVVAVLDLDPSVHWVAIGVLGTIHGAGTVATLNIVEGITLPIGGETDHELTRVLVGRVVRSLTIVGRAY